jgi:hypothetical protein
MPSISKHERARGGYRPSTAPEVDLDWSVPTDAVTLMGRRLPRPDQSKYGRATTDPLGREGAGWHKGPSGLPVKDKGEK